MKNAMVAIAATALLAGCGGSTSNEEAQVRDVVTRFATAFVNGDGDEACHLMTSQAVSAATLGGTLTDATDCGSTMTSAAKTISDADATAMSDVKITAVKIKGDSAVATLSQSINGDEQVFLKNTVAGWRIDVAP